jgi:hypothetical protein
MLRGLSKQGSLGLAVRFGVLLGLCVLALAFGSAAAEAAGAPQIVAGWSSEVSSSSVRLNAEVNPEGSSTGYRFEYISSAAYEANVKASKEGFAGATRVPVGSLANIGSGTAALHVSESVSHLNVETSYRFRAFAESSAGPVLGGELTFITQGLGSALHLLDNRGWEMVSPIEKNGGEVQGFGANSGGDVLQAAADGQSATFSSASSFGGDAQGAPVASQYISRRGAGSWSTQDITLPTLSGAYGEEPDGVPYQLFSSDLARSIVFNGGRCGEGGKCPRGYSLREEGGGLSLSPEEPDLTFAGASPDLRHVVLSTCAALTPEALEVKEGAGCDPADPNLYEWSEGTLSQVNAVASEILPAPFARLAAPAGAVSSDGRRVYWNDPKTGDLFLHEEGAPTKSVDGSVGGGGVFQTAAANGSIAFFTKGEALYRYSALTETSEPLASEVQGVLGASEDGSHVYYLTAAGLFLWNAGTPTPIATVSGAASESDYPPATGSARVSVDGTRLLFLSKASLTGFDNTDADTGQPDSEVFLYDAAANGGAGALSCVSCNPTDERPIGPSTIPGAIANGADPGATQAYKPRVLSSGGGRVFFDSGDSLVLQDTDNRPDVYEWEEQGVGSCARGGGCLQLISAGFGEGASFVDAAANGSDAFFLTGVSLVPSDPGSVDLYDAREGGGFPVPPKPIPCEGDACQSLPSPPDNPLIGTIVPGEANPPVFFPKTGKKKPPHKKPKHKKHHHGGARGGSRG